MRRDKDTIKKNTNEGGGTPTPSSSSSKSRNTNVKKQQQEQQQQQAQAQASSSARTAVMGASSEASSRAGIRIVDGTHAHAGAGGVVGVGGVVGARSARRRSTHFEGISQRIMVERQEINRLKTELAQKKAALEDAERQISYLKKQITDVGLAW